MWCTEWLPLDHDIPKHATMIGLSFGPRTDILELGVSMQRVDSLTGRGRMPLSKMNCF